ncbi:hypothetical protein RB195_022269 [Necator americanus]|uniref:Endonuclease/exonuclease/phosphatase domain-containing protein n=1 Tax=Necator americanus TaxID=51031 RepID=A0ABR1EEM3_NECAM
MHSLATTIRFVTLNRRTLANELQAALSGLLRYLCVPFAALQETRVGDRPVTSIENYTIYCGDADENKMRLSTTAGSQNTTYCCTARNVNRGRKHWIVSAHAPTETAEDNSKDAFYDKLNALMSKIPRKQVDIVGIDANANMGLEQQSDVLGKWYYPAKRTSDNGERLVDSCEQTDLIISFMFDRNHRRYHIMWQGSINLTPEEQRKRKIKTLKLQLDYVLARDIPRSDIRKSRAVWDVAFDSDHRPVLLSFNTRFHKKNRGVPLQSTSQRDHFKTLLHQQASSVPELGHVDRPKYAVNEEPPTESEPPKYKQMWVSARPQTEIRVDGQPIELIDELRYLGCMLKNNDSYEEDIQQICAKATTASP